VRARARLACWAALLAIGCGGRVEAGGCDPADRGAYAFELHEIEGTCGARGHMPPLDTCERTTAPVASADGCELIESYTCPRPDGGAIEIDLWTRALDARAEHLSGIAEITMLGPAPESLGAARVLCWSRYAVEGHSRS
jgi:hypothetical protein